MTEPDITEVCIGDGECWIGDPDFMDLENRVEGVLALQYTVERGLWALVGRDTDGRYAQTWEPVGEAAKGGKLRPVN